jgi:hypothetical protein
MRLSEAILLGSTGVKAKPGMFLSGDHGEGCALGMAAVASGFSLGKSNVPSRTGNAEYAWPWLMNTVRRPCSCWLIGMKLKRRMTIYDAITHVFDKHIFEKRDWTIDRLSLWLKTVEPAELT